MLSRPPDLSDAVVAAAASAGWQLPPAAAEYRPIGFGSHHWSVTDAAGARWFASVDALDPEDPQVSFDRLAAALTLAAAARDAGLTFVVAPVRAPNGSVLHRLLDRYALALYPHVTGAAGSFSDALSTADATELITMLAALHSAIPPTTAVNIGAGVERFALAGRRSLQTALAELGDPHRWPGPYGGRLRPLLATQARIVHQALREHDRLVTAAGRQTPRLVLTHGEPHPGNLIRTPDGLVLIDWDTALLAPPERDVWLLDAHTNGQASAEYTARAGRELQPELLERYDLAWSLADLAVLIDLLRACLRSPGRLATPRIPPGGVVGLDVTNRR